MLRHSLDIIPNLQDGGPCCLRAAILKEFEALLLGLRLLFLDRGHTRFWNFDSTVPADDVRVKSYVNCLFDPTGVPIRITIN